MQFPKRKQVQGWIVLMAANSSQWTALNCARESGEDGEY